MSEIDYNYYTTPKDLERELEKIGGLAGLLAYCQTNEVQVTRGADYMYGATINGTGLWSTDEGLP